MTDQRWKLHPLNRAAANRLKALGAESLPLVPALCLLAVCAVDEEYGENSTEAMRAEQLLGPGSPAMCKYLANNLDLTAQELQSMDLKELGREIAYHLQPLPARD